MQGGAQPLWPPGRGDAFRVPNLNTGTSLPLQAARQIPSARNPARQFTVRVKVVVAVVFAASLPVPVTVMV